MKRVVAALVVFAFAVRALLIFETPFMPLGDSYTRLDQPREIVKFDWLPAYQATLAFVDLFSHDVVAFRLATAAQSALAAGAMALLASRVAGTAGALFVGLGMSVLPILAFTGLYQESLFLFAASAGLCALTDRGARHDGAAAGLLSLACLTRYEAWLLVPFLWLATFVGARDRRRSYELAALCTSFVVAGWLVFSGGRVSPIGTASLFVVETTRAFATDARGFWHALAVQHEGLLVAVGCATGLVAFRRAPVALGIPLAVLAADIVFVLIERPYSPPTNPRIAVIPSVVALWMLAIGWDALMRDRTRWTVVAWEAALFAATVGPALSTLHHDIRSFGAPTRSVGQVAEAIDTLGDVGVLVLTEGVPGYPDATPGECHLVAAHAPSARVTCDNQEGAESAFANVDVRVRVGDFAPWRPVHELRSTWPSLHSGAIEVWARTEAERRALVGALDRIDPEPCATSVGDAGWLASARVDGELVRVEPRRVAFYANGSVDVPIAHDGSLRAWICGTADREGRAALDLAIGSDGTSSERVTASPSAAPIDLGPVRAGDVLRVRFGNDHTDDRGGDRNAFLVGVEDGGAP